MEYNTIPKITKALCSKKISCVEIITDHINRIKKFDKKINSFITTNFDNGIAKAKKMDENFKIFFNSKDKNPIFGVPIAYKDILCTKNILTTCGSKMLKNFIPTYNATVVDFLEESNAISLGKLNMDEFAMGSSSETSFFGPVKNPWDTEFIPGGSSGGSAAAVSSELIIAALGSDTGGSIRQPASMCGVTGIKPTYGRISRYGVVAFASSLDQIGPLAKTAEECAILLNHMCKHDPLDSTSIVNNQEDFTKNLNNSIKGLKIGIPKEYFSDALDKNISKLILNAISELEKNGAIIKEINIPLTESIIPTYYIISCAECSSNLARYDGIKFGYKEKSPLDLDSFYKKNRGGGFGKEVKKRILTGTYVLSSGCYNEYYNKAQKIRRMISNIYLNHFKNNVDLIVGPTSPIAAYKIGSKIKNKTDMYLSDVYTVSANLAGLPAISIPVGFIKKLPVGMQLMSSHMNESLLLNVSHIFQKVTDWHLKKPKI